MKTEDRPTDSKHDVRTAVRIKKGGVTSSVATCEGRVLAAGVPDEGGLGAPHSQQAGGGGVEEHQLQPALTWLQSQLRSVGLLLLGLTQAPQLHLNTHRRVKSEDIGRI